MAEEAQEKKESAVINFVCPICKSPMRKKSVPGFCFSETMVCTNQLCPGKKASPGWCSG